MSIDRDKIAKSALKFIQKGQFQKAIEEYRKVLSSDPRDIRTRLKLIDLYGRTGKKKEAIEECLQVAESYSDQGFYLKAIAVYKQALRIDPENSVLFSNMGELYVKQGLVGDALASFKKGVDCLRQRGQIEEAEELLTRMEEMAPENAAIKVHLAEMYLEDGKIQAFAAELDKIVLQLKGEGRARKLLQAMEGFYEKSDHHPVVLKRLAELYSDLHEDEKALEVVRGGLAVSASDRDLRLLALRSYLALGDVVEARRVALGLCEEDPEDLFILEQLVAIAQARGDRSEEAQAHKALAKVYGRRGLPQKEEHHYRKVLGLLPQDAEARLALGQVMEVRDAAPEPEPRKLEAFWDEAPGQGPSQGTAGVQEGLVEADLYLKYGLEEKAAEKLRELTEAAPDNVEIRQKLRDLCQRRGDRAGWVREQLHIAELHLRRHRESDALRAYQAILEVDPDSQEARQALLYLKQDALPSRVAPIEIDVDGSTIEFVEVGGQEAAVRSRPEKPAEGELLRDGLAEADFYEVQGRTEEALGALLRLRTQYPDSPHVVSRLERLGWQGDAGTAGADAYMDLQAEIIDASSLSIASEFEGFQDFEVSELDDIVREFKSGIAEKLSDGDYDTHYNLGVAYKEMGLLDDALQEFQVAARSPEKARDAYTSISLVYRDLNRAENAREALRMALAVAGNTDEDRAAIHYELGVMAQEEEDWEGALKAFQRVAAIDPAFRDVPYRLRLAQTRRVG